MAGNHRRTGLIRREILVSILIIGFASMSLGVVTWAYFSDSDASQQNQIQAGTLDLSLDGADSLTAAFSISNGQPSSATSHNFTLQNDGSLGADHVKVTLSFSENDSRSEPSDVDLNVELNATETASLINVTQFEYQNNAGETMFDALANVNDQNGNGIVDLEDVQAQEGQLDDLAPPQKNNGNSTFLVIALEIANDDSAAFTKGGNTNGSLTGYDEDIMADGVDVKLTVTLNQDASQ